MESGYRPTKQFLDEAQVDETFIHKIQYAMNTRSKITRSTASQPEKNQERKKNINKKEVYIPPLAFQIPPPQLISFDAFRTHFSEIIIHQKKEKVQNILNNINILYNIYKSAHREGGLLYVSSIGNFPSIVKAVILLYPMNIQSQLTHELIETIRKLLYSIQFIHENPDEQKKLYQLGQVTFVSQEELKTHINDKQWGLNHFNYDLTLFQEGAEAIQIDKFIFNLEYMCEHYKKDKIDIRIQNPLDYGFKPTKLKNKKYSMVLGDYRFYQLNYRSTEGMKNFKHLDQLGKGQIFFGVNFEPSDQMLNKEIKKNVNDTFFDFHGDFDLMSYLDSDVPGCSLPQMYFKTSGCWTGGHQQNISMAALNINHGPDASQWYTLDLKYIEKLRNQLNEFHGMDLYIFQGLWYEKIQWFISHGYPVKRFLQRKDDIVVTGPGTLHWVRSFGMALHTSWNIMPKNYDQFAAALERHQINKQIKFQKSDTIPLKSLILKYLNHERTTMSQNMLQLCVKSLQKWYRQELQIVDELFDRVKQKSYFYLRDLESFCCLCKQEVLVYFLAAPAEFTKGISCLECFVKSCKSNLVINQLYFKQEIYWIEKLIELCKDPENRKKYPDQFQALCKGVYVGKIKGCKFLNRQKVNLPIFNHEQEKRNFLREIYSENQDLLEIHESIDKLFNKNKDIIQHMATYIKEKTNGPPINAKPEQLKESEMKPEGEVDTKTVKKLEERECQTQIPYPQPKEEGQIESQKSRSREKKKKKHKSQHKHKHKKENMKECSDNSDENKERSKSNSRKSNENKKASHHEWRQQQSQYKDNNRNNFNRDNQYSRDRDNFKSFNSFNKNRDNYGSYNDNNQRNHEEYNKKTRNEENQGSWGNWRNRDNNYNKFGRYQNNKSGSYQSGNRDNQRGWNNQWDQGQKNFNNNERDNQNDRWDRGQFRGGRGRGNGREGFYRDNNFRTNGAGNNNQSNYQNNENVEQKNNFSNTDNILTASKFSDPEQY